ncbi:autotransporter secretion inner membrane protein TamB [Palleronia marisminoris]|uniref:Translocation and assembly module TamB n=1 Tax=Palleronia marisminoris TaxID=315423 RepID=A0A1Y5T242_9RHOB|nr:translocation/assembly module TamB domain-containing protein [Palleronia marisminoris]SFH04596.1 autotransporter secretion inner membrane protein TamB [Palleronia marisminoris]SLN50374.1 Translocation and assembly module TamB [Palleronia marisminoris]
MRKIARLCVLSLGLAAVPVAAQNTDAEDEDGGGFLENLIEDRLSSEGFQVEVRGFQGALSSRATIGQITIADAEGVWLTINDAVLDWNRSALLRGRLSVDEIAAAEILLPRLPQGEEQLDVPQPEAQPFSLPELPVSINIGQINAERIELGEPVIGEEAVITLEGSAQLANGEGEVDVRAERIDDELGIFQIAGSFENGSRQLEVNVALEEGPDGVVANLIDLPGRPALSASVEGSGPLSDFEAAIDLDTDGEDRLDGTVALRDVDDTSRFAVDLSGDVTALFAPTYRPFFGPNVSLEAEGARFPDGAIAVDELSLQAQALNLQGEVRIGPDNVPNLIDVTGEIANQDGTPVLLPVGEGIRVNRVGLDVDFDASESEEWSGEIVIEGLDQPGFAAERVALDGSGIIAGSGETLDVEAGFDFTAAGLSLDDGGLAQALGDEIDGRIELGYEAGEPILLNTLNLSGEGFSLEGSGEVDPDGENVPLSLTAALDAEDMSVFSGLAGRPLDGAASLDIDLTAEALSGAFDVTLEGRTQDLETGIAEVDPLLTGATLLDLAAERDETGLRVERLVLQNEQIDVTASADLSSDGGTAEIDARVEDLSLIDPTLSGPATLTATAARPEDVWQIDLNFEGAEAVVSGDVAIRELEAESPLAVFDLVVVADDLANFGAILDQPLSGAVDVSARGQGRLDLSNGNVVLDGTTTDIEIGQEEVDRLLSGRTDIDVSVRREGPQFTVPILSIENPQITVTGDAFYGAGQGAVDARILLDELGDVVPEMSGPADISLEAVEGEDGWVVDLDAIGAGARVVADVTVEDLQTVGISPRVAGSAEVSADDLSVFSSLANRELGGSVDLSLNGGGRFDLSEASVDAEGTARDLEIGIEEVDRLLSGVTELSVDAAKDGDVIDVNELSIENPQISVSGRGDINPGDSAAQLRVELDELGDVVPEMQGPATITLDATEEGDVWTLDVDASGAGAEIVADATIEDLRTEGVSPLVDGTAEVEVDDLSVFSSLANRELGGTVDMSLTGSGRFDLSEAAIDAEGTARNLEIGIEEVDRLLSGVTELSIDAAKDGDAIDVNELTLENPQISVQGQGDINPGDSSARLQVELDELGDVIPEMRGPATIILDATEDGDVWSLDVDATGAGAQIVADATVEDLRTEGVSPLVDGTAEVEVDDLSVFSRIANRELGGAVDLSLDGRTRFDLSEAAVEASGTTRNLAIGQPEVDRLLEGLTTFDVAAEKDGETLQIETLQVENPQINAVAEGSYGGPDANALQANVTVAELSDVLPELSGRATVNLVAEETGDAWQVALDGDGAGVVVDLLGEVSNLDATPAFDGRVNLQAQDISRFSRLAGRSLSGSVTLEAEGEAALDGSRFDGTANAQANNLRVGVPQVDQLLSGGTTTLTAEASRSGPNAPIQVQRFQLDAPGLDAQANGAILGGASNLTLDARLADLGAYVPNFSGPVTAQGSVGQSGSNITLDVALTGPQGLTARIDGTVAESFNQANIDITGDAPLRLANPYLGNRALSGTASYDLSLNGPLALTSLGGTVTVSGGRLVDPSVPFVLNDINGTAQIQGDQVVLNVTADKQEGGTLALAGTIGLSGGYPADLGVELNRVVVEDPRLYRTVANGRVTLTGPLTGGAVIGGTVILGQTEIRVPSTGLGATGPIPAGLVHVNEPKDVYRTRARADLVDAEDAEADAGPAVVYGLDLTILAEDQIFVRGRGLDAELGGQLTLGGTTANVIPTGRFELIRGRIDLLGQRITLTEGYVTLAGDFTPTIRLVARTETDDDVTVLIIVEGEATEPDITFSSEPELPEDEVLSRLLFGRSIDNISALQAAQLANAVATLSGRGGIGIIENLRESTGLDDLDVTTDEEGNVGLQAGAYLSENVYSSVNVDSEGEAEINLNLDVTDSITVRGAASNEGETSLGVFFERDY